MGYLSLSRQGLILEGNLTAAKLLGVGRGALMNQPVSRFILPADQDIYCRHRRQLAATSTPQACEMRMVREGGEVFWARLEATAAQDADGSPVCRAVLTDVTRRHGADEEVASLARFPAENPHPVLRVARNGTLLYANAAAGPLLRSWGAQLGSALPASLWQQVTAALTDGAPAELEVACEDRAFALTWASVPDTDYINVYGLDVSDRKRAEAHLRESEETYRALIEGLPDVVMRYGPDGRHLFVSDNVSEMVDLQAAQFIGKTHGELGFPAGLCRLWEEAIQGVFASGAPFETEFALEGSHGPTTLNWRLVPERDAEGTVRSVLALSRDITAQRRAEQDYRTLFHEMLDGFALHEIICDVAGAPIDYRFLAVNPAFERMTGLGADGLVGRTVREALPGTEPRWIERYGKVALTGEPAFFEDYHSELDRHFEVTAFRPAPNRFACIFADITERRRTQAALEASEQRFRELADLLPQTVFETDAHGALTFVNRQALAEFGYTADEAAGLSVQQVVDPADRARSAERFLSVLHGASGTGQQYTLVRKDGSAFPGLIYSSPVVRTGEPAGLRGLIVNIADRLALEERLRTSQRVGWALLNATSEAALLVDTRGVILGANGAAAEYLATRWDLLIDRRLAGVLAPEHAAGLMARIEEVVAAGEPLHYQDVRNGRYFADTIQPILDSDGNVTQLAIFARDVTELRLAEDAQRLALVGGIAAGVAHEFNNLLAGMMLGAEWAMLSSTLGEHEKLADLVLRATRRGAEICQSLTAFARPREPARVAMHVETATEAALSVVGRQLETAGVAVVRGNHAAGKRIAGDQSQLEQVFINLFINACHAMPAGGTLTVISRHEPASEGFGEVVVTVTDTGTGIRPEDLPRIFDPFFTTKGRLGDSDVPGTGLGLSVTHGIVRAHGATIGVRSTPGAGTTFELRFPVHDPLRLVAAESDGRDPAAAPCGVRPLRILVAEDEDDLRQLLAKNLQAVGHEVVCVRNGLDAVAAVREGAFDLVITDLLMPGGGGREVLAVAPSLPTPLPVIVITGRIEPHVVGEFAALGARAYLRKPFSFPDVLRAIAEVVAPD